MRDLHQSPAREKTRIALELRFHIFLNPGPSHSHPKLGYGIGVRMLNAILTAEEGFGAPFGAY